MAVTYDYYRIFYYAAKYRSFTRAAKILSSSQPNITRAMNNLEQELGCRLFQRSHRGVALTPEGERLLSHVQIVQEQLQAAEAELAAERALQSGHVSIGASEIALHGLLLPVLRGFRLTYPGVHIQIMNHSTPQAVEAVKTGTVDFAVVTSPTGAAAPLKEEALVEYRDILIAGPYFSELGGKPYSLGELADYPWVSMSRNTRTFEFYDRFFTRHHQILQPDVEAATTDQILPLVRYDLGLGFLPKGFAVAALEKGEVISIDLVEEIPKRSICLVWDKSRPLSTAAKELMRQIRTAAGENEPFL